MAAPTSAPSPVEEVARRAFVAALRAALVEACAETLPPIDAHPAHAIAWAMVCSPLAPPPATIATDAAR